MKLWALKYTIGIAFLASHLVAAAIIWFLMTPRPLGEEDASTLFFIILPLTSFYTVSFVKDIAKRQEADQFYENVSIAPWSGYVQIFLVIVFGVAIIGLLLGFFVSPYEFPSLKLRFGILDATFTGIIGAISENLFGAVRNKKSPQPTAGQPGG